MRGVLLSRGALPPGIGGDVEVIRSLRELPPRLVVNSADTTPSEV
jgi:hypothetical protein